MKSRFTHSRFLFALAVGSTLVAVHAISIDTPLALLLIALTWSGYAAMVRLEGER